MTEQKELPCPSCKQLPETMTQGIYTGMVCRVENRCPRPLALWRLCIGDAREGWNELVARTKPAEDERVKEIRKRRDALGLRHGDWPCMNVHNDREIEFQKHILEDIDYLLSLLPVQPAASTPTVPLTEKCRAKGDEGAEFCGEPRSLHCQVLGDSAFWKSAEGQRHLVKCMRDDHLIHHSFIAAHTEAQDVRSNNGNKVEP